MRNYRENSYQRLRSLYEQRFISQDWQPNHLPTANCIKFKNNHLSVNQSSQRDYSLQSKALINPFGKYQQLLNSQKSHFLMKEKPKTPKSQIYIVCQYTEQTPKSFWMKDSQKFYHGERRKAFTTQVKQRKRMSAVKCMDSKETKRQTLQLKHKDFESRVSKKSTIIKILESLKSQKKEKKIWNYQTSRQAEYKYKQKNDGQQKVLSFIGKKDLQQHMQKSKTHRGIKNEYFQVKQHQPKIDGWYVVQHQY